MASDISIRVTSDISDIQRDLNSLSGDFDRLGDVAERSNENLGRIGALQRLEALDNVAGKVNEISNVVIDFGMKSIESAAEWEATVSQFSQVWGNMAVQADVSLNKIADKAGILPNRMRPSFIKIGAFAKTTGADTAQALDIASRAMVASADSAAFYDRSLEDTTESLQSFLKGNFENDAALGLSATETTRNAKANELYGKSFIELAEDQKQLTLLAMVEDANKLSGAFGQAERESDGFENQMGNLNQQITDFQNQIGRVMLPAFIDGLKILGGIVEDLRWAWTFLSEPMKQFILGIGAGIVLVGQILPIITGLGMAMTALNTTMLPIILVVGAIILAIGLAVVAFNNWDEAVQIFSDAWAVVWEWLQATFPETIAMITEIVNWLVENWDTIKNVIITTWDAIVVSVKGALDTLWILIQNGMQSIDIIIGTAWELIKVIVKGAWDWITNIIDTGIKVIQGIIKVVMSIIKGDWKGAWEGIKDIVKAVFNGISSFIGNVISTISGVVGKGLTGIAKLFANIFNGTFETVKSVFNNIKNTIKSVIDNVKKLFNFKLKFPEISIPHIKLPHFSISGEFNPLKGKLPSIGIDWYAKGGIMTKPTAFGMNGNNMMVGGEAGNEAILPLNNRNLSVIGAMIADTMQMNQTGGGIGQVNITVQGDVDSQERINQITEQVSETLLTQYNQQYTWN